MNPMKDIKIEKVTLNMGAGKDQVKLDKGFILLKKISGMNPVKTYTKKRIPEWGLRPGLPIGCKVTIRKEKTAELLKRLLDAKGNKLKPSQFDESGNVSFGIHEYIDIAGVEYDPNIGIIGLEVCITLERPGFRIKLRSNRKSKIGKNHLIKRQEAIDFMTKNFGVVVEDE